MERIACSPAEAAEMIGVCTASIYNWMKDGRIESVKVGRRRLVKVASIQKLVRV